MISSKEANPTLNSLSECINVSISDKEFSFQYPASEYMRNVVIGILQSKAYPILNLSNYYPNIIMDIGANIGATSLYFHAYYPESKIYCYEPSEKNYRYLIKNLHDINGMYTFPYGLHNKSSEVPLYLGRDQSAQNSIYSNNDTTDQIEMVKLVKDSK